MADPAPKAAAAPVEAAPVAPPAPPAKKLPETIHLAKHHAWFSNGVLVERHAGELITDAGEIAYLLSRDL